MAIQLGALINSASPENYPDVDIETYASSDNKDHKFTLSTKLCDTQQAGCDEEFANKVFDYVNKNDIPFTDYDLREGTHTLLSFNPIDHEEDPSNRTSKNETLKGHAFDPGSVTHRVNFGDDGLYYTVVGEGSGGQAKINNRVGIREFGSVMQDVANKFAK